MSVQVANRAVLVSDANDRAVVARDNHDRIRCELQLFKCLHNLTNAPIKLHDHIAASATTTFANKTRMWHAGRMRVMCRKFQKERFFRILLDELQSLGRQHFGLGFILPTRRMTARHEADAADAVDDRSFMTCAQSLLEQLRVLFARRLISDFLPITDLDGIFRIKADDAMILDIHAGHSISRGRLHEAIIKTDLQGAGLDLAVPIRSAPTTQAEMPFADETGAITRLLQHGWQCGAVCGYDERGITGQDLRSLFAPGIFARKQREA